MDAWKLAEIKGTLYSLLLKVDVLTAEDEDMRPVQADLAEALEYLEEVEEREYLKKKAKT